MEIKGMDIYNYMDKMGIKHANTGYRYLATAIRICTDSPEMGYNMTYLYRIISEMFDTKMFCVERAMRYSLSMSMMTNKEFVSKAVDYIICSNTLDEYSGSAVHAKKQISLNDPDIYVNVHHAALSSSVV